MQEAKPWSIYADIQSFPGAPMKILSSDYIVTSRLAEMSKKCAFH